MLIIAGKEYVAAEHRDAYVAQFAAFIRRTRTEPGCLDFIIAADPIEATRVNTFEVWESHDILAAFRRNANPPQTTIEILDEQVQKYVIRRSGPPFP